MRLRFFLAEAVRSIRANAAVSIAATVTVLIAVFILGAFIPSFLYVQSAVDSQKSRIDVRVYISDAAKVAQVNQLQAAISDLEARGLIKESTYINKDQALAELKSRLKDPDITDLVGSNPVPANFRLKPSDVEQAPQIVAALQGQPAVDQEQGISYGKETADKLLSVARFIQWAGLGLITILLVASILLIGNTIRLSIFARRREVEVMKLVGATDWFIRWPFVIEGVLVGALGGIMAILLLAVGKVALIDPLASDFALIAAPETINFGLLVVVVLASSIAVSAAGSGLSLRRFLRV